METFAETALTDTFADVFEAADALCQAEADAANLNGTFVAWLGGALLTPKERLYYNAKWKVVGTSSYVASGRADLVDGTIGVGIDRDALGAAISNSQVVWTGASTAGGSGLNCGNWASSGSGGSGTAGMTSASWTAAADIDCTSTGRLYCFEVTGAERGGGIGLNGQDSQAASQGGASGTLAGAGGGGGKGFGAGGGGGAGSTGSGGTGRAGAVYIEY